MSESDADIYDDLPDFLFGEKEELQANIDELIEKNDALQSRLQKTSLSKKELEEKIQALSLNISMLFKTAQAEISRKDKTIKSLRDELDKCQCRKRRWNGENVYNSSQDVKRYRIPQKRDVSPVKNSFTNKTHEIKTRSQSKNTSKENIVPVNLINKPKNVAPVTLFSQRMSLKIQKLAEQEAILNQSKDVPNAKVETLKENASSISNVQNVNGVKKDEIHNPVEMLQKDSSKNKQDDVHKAGKRITRRSRCPINPISKDWNVKNSSPPRKTSTMQPPVKKMKSQEVPNMMIDIFGSPTKWADSSSNDEDEPKTDFTSPAVFEDSCSAQIDNSQFAEKAKTVAALNSAIKDNRPFQSINKPYNEDTLIGQFETTTQFISSLTVVQNKISPFNTPIKAQLSDSSDKPINILQPRKAPRIVTKQADKPLIKTFSLKDSFLSEQEEKVKNLKTTNDKILHVFGSPKNGKKKHIEWVLKPLDVQPKTTTRRQSLNMDISPRKQLAIKNPVIIENKTPIAQNLDQSAKDLTNKINLANINNTPQTKESHSKTDKVCKIIRNNRKIKLSNSDNPGKVVVAKYRPIRFSSTDM